jgi:uncharacterized protein DUF3551
MRSIAMRKIVPVLALSALGLLGTVDTSSADYLTYPWCAQMGGGRGGSRNCGFWTYEQCMATLWGNGGYCEHNPLFRGPQPGMIPPPYGPPGRARY